MPTDPDTRFDDDEELLSDAQTNARILVIVFAETLKIKETLKQIQSKSNDFQIDIFGHDAAAAQAKAAAAVVMVECRMMTAFADLRTIRTLRQSKPMTPIFAFTTNMDPDFILEIFKSGASDIIAPDLHQSVLAEKTRVFAKMGESGRLVEVQNAEMMRNMKAQREEREKALLAEKEKSIALVQANANKQMREILDNLNDGFFTIEADLTIGSGVSKACATIFSGDIASKALGNILNFEDGKEEFFKQTLVQLFEDIMPLELNVSMLPKKAVTKDGKSLEFKYSAVLAETKKPIRVIVIVSDITVIEVERAAMQAQLATNLSLINIMKNKETFLSFLHDFRRDINMLKGSIDLVNGKRILHTLKGNSASFGMEAIARRIHDRETGVKDADDPHKELVAAALDVENVMKTFLEDNRTVLNTTYFDDLKPKYTVDEETLEKILRLTNSASDSVKTGVDNIVQDLKKTPISALASVFETNVKRIAKKTHKDVKLEMVGLELKVNFELLKPLLNNLIHAITNAVDHGIELPEDRANKGKKQTGRIEIVFEKPTNLEIKISVLDDGKGIDPERVLQKAIAKQIVTPIEAKTMSKEDVLNLIFLDDFSTHDDATEFSGRGIGMSALKNEIEALNGSFKLRSEIDAGTTLEIIIPKGNRAPHSKRVRILIAEANPRTVEMYLRSFYQFNFELKIVGNGLDALLAIANNHFDVFICGLHLPILEGAEVVRKVVKSMDDKAGLSIVIISAYVTPEIVKEFSPFENIHILKKPIKFNQIIESIKASLRAWKKSSTNKILVVDDSEMNIRIFRRIFRKSNFNVRYLGDAAKAIDFISTIRNKPDLVIMNIDMHNLQGIHAIRTLKADLTNKSMPIIAVSVNPDLKIDAMNAGSGVFLHKLSKFDLLSAVDRLISNYQIGVNAPAAQTENITIF